MPGAGPTSGMWFGGYRYDVKNGVGVHVLGGYGTDWDTAARRAVAAANAERMRQSWADDSRHRLVQIVAL